MTGDCLRSVGILLLGGAQHATREPLAGVSQARVNDDFAFFIPRRTFWPRIAASVLLSTIFHLGLAIILLSAVLAHPADQAGYGIELAT